MVANGLVGSRELPYDLSRNSGPRFKANMGYSATLNQTEPEERERWAFTYRVEGDIRFISHRDTMRLFERALARANLPVRYSQGFNPHAKLSISLPRPVGVASQGEVVVIEFTRALNGAETLAELGRQMPDGIDIVDAKRLRPGERLTPSEVRYSIEIAHDLLDDLRERARSILVTDEIMVERTFHKNGHTRQFNARHFISDVAVRNDKVLFTLLVTRDGTLRPVEFARILGLDASTVAHRIRRLGIEWQNELKRANISHDTTEDARTNKDKEGYSKKT